MSPTTKIEDTGKILTLKQIGNKRMTRSTKKIRNMNRRHSKKLTTLKVFKTDTKQDEINKLNASFEGDQHPKKKDSNKQSRKNNESEMRKSPRKSLENQRKSVNREEKIRIENNQVISTKKKSRRHTLKF